jgi:hypothetical protein
VHRRRNVLGLVPVALLGLAVVVSATVVLALSRTHDLEFEGAAAFGEIGLDGGAQAGETVGFAMPQMRNASGSPVRIDGFEMDHIPSGTRLVGFRLLSVDDTDGVQLGSFAVDHRCDDRSGSGYNCYPDYLPKHPTIKPGHLSELYPVVYIEVLRPPVDDAYYASGCEYLYTVEGVQHRQRAPCQFSIGPST